MTRNVRRNWIALLVGVVFTCLAFFVWTKRTSRPFSYFAAGLLAVWFFIVVSPGLLAIIAFVRTTKNTRSVKMAQIEMKRSIANWVDIFLPVRKK